MKRVRGDWCCRGGVGWDRVVCWVGERSTGLIPRCGVIATLRADSYLARLPVVEVWAHYLIPAMRYSLPCSFIQA